MKKWEKPKVTVLLINGGDDPSKNENKNKRIVS